MFRSGTLLLALAATPRVGCTPPRARVTIEALEASRPPYAWARCLTVGLKAPVTYAWKLPAELKPIGWNAPRDQGALFLGLPEGSKRGSRLRCTATGADDTRAVATAVYGPLEVTQVALGDGILTVTGSGFGPAPAAEELGEDGVYLVPSRGRAILASQFCPAAQWSDERIVACLPADARGRFAVRVASGGRLAQAPSPVTLGAAK